jgi:oligopeptide/dipeptide ABC transporter ATP-binding protein
VVAGVADDVMVMYAGRQVEFGGVDDVFYRSAHPYTEGLLLSVPKVEGELGPLRPIGGQPPSVIDLPSGCAFHPRCRYARLGGVCTEEVPPLVDVSETTAHRSACHFATELMAGTLEPTR